MKSAAKHRCHHGNGFTPWLWLFTTVLTLVFFTGCGNQLPTLEGKVTVDGQPPPGGDFRGQIAFKLQGGGPVADAKIMPDGSYSVNTASQEGLAPGTYDVAVTGMVGIPRPTLPGQQNDGTQKWIPIKYSDFRTSGLTYEVQPGENVWNLDIDTKQ